MSVIIQVPAPPVPPTVEVELTHAVVLTGTHEFLAAFDNQIQADNYIEMRRRAFGTLGETYRVVDL